MDEIELAPYIFFSGQCREAMEHYQKIFGGKLDMQSYDDMPDMPNKDEMKGLLMNASLTGGAVVIRGSDIKSASPATKKIELCLTGSDEAKLRKIFDELGKGGKINYPLKKEFWGDIFGKLTDKFGVEWMVDINPKK